MRLGRRVLRVAKSEIWVGMGLSMTRLIFAAQRDIPSAIGALLQEDVDMLVVLNVLPVFVSLRRQFTRLFRLSPWK